MQRTLFFSALFFLLLGLIPATGTRAATYTGVIMGGITTDSDCVRGNGQVGKEHRSLAPFQGIRVSGAFTVHLTCSGAPGADLEMDGNILPLVSTKVENGLLVIDTTRSVCVDNPLRIALSSSSLAQIISDGANDLIVDCTGYSTLDISLAGASTLRLSGRGKQLNVLLEEASELDASGNQVERATVTARSSTTAVIVARQAITAESTDASEIYYNDDVPHIQKTVLDAGEILPLSQR